LREVTQVLSAIASADAKQARISIPCAARRSIEAGFTASGTKRSTVSSACADGTTWVNPWNFARDPSSPKTLGKLDPAESDRVVRFARLMGKAVEVLESEDNARRWLNSPQFGLGGAVPLEYAKAKSALARWRICSTASSTAYTHDAGSVAHR